MLAEVISIGDELTSGQRLDTNSQWLSERLGELGVRVLFHTTVADDLEANVGVFRTAVERADLIVATGGLGPTADDLTREALASLVGRELVLHQESLERIKAMFAFFKRDMPQRNVIQAMFPEGSTPIFNPNGTAPGILLEVPRSGRSSSRIFALPGVPAEMQQMWHESLAPTISRLTGGGQVLRHRRIKCFGAGESHVEAMLPDIIRRGREPSVGITVSGATITLRITARGADAEACERAIAPTIETIHQCLGELVFGEEEDELEHAVARLLVAKRKTLATVECGTGGLIAHWLNEVPSLAGQYLGGVVLPTSEAAARLLEVNALAGDTSQPEGSELIKTIAQRTRERFGADFALAVGELPQPMTGAETAPSVQYALAGMDDTITRSVPYVGHPSIHKVRTAKVGLNLVRLVLARGVMS